MKQSFCHHHAEDLIASNLSCPSQRCGCVQVLQGIAANHLLIGMDDTLQSGFVLGSGSSVVDGDGGGEERLNHGGVKLYHHGLRQVIFLQLVQEVAFC